MWVLVTWIWKEQLVMLILRKIKLVCKKVKKRHDHRIWVVPLREEKKSWLLSKMQVILLGRLAFFLYPGNYLHRCQVGVLSSSFDSAQALWLPLLLAILCLCTLGLPALFFSTGSLSAQSSLFASRWVKCFATSLGSSWASRSREGEGGLGFLWSAKSHS